MVTTKVENSAIQLASAVNIRKIWGDLIYNVKAYGAKFDGSTDDTLKIQAAIDAAYAAGGGIVRCPEGTSIVSGLRMKTNVTLEGTGKKTTILKVPNNAAFRTMIGIDNFATSVVIRDLCIDGNRANQSVFDGYGIFSYRSSNGLIDNVMVKNTSYIGIGLSNCDGYTIQYSWIERSYHAGIWLFSDIVTAPMNEPRHVICNVDSTYNDLDGIICDTNYVTITTSRFNYNGQDPHGGGAIGGAGIYNGKRTSNLRIINNECSYNTEFGINLTCVHTIIGSNLCSYNGLSGINLKVETAGQESQRVTINNNVSFNNGNNPTTFPLHVSKSGISIDQCAFITISGNLLYDDRGTQTQRHGVDAFDYSGSSNFITVIGNQLKYNILADETVSTATGITNKYVAGNV